MEISTTYFANLRNLPSNVIPVSIARQSPKGWAGIKYKRLAPTWEILRNWKSTHDEIFYREEFSKILGKLNADSVVWELRSIGDCIALICYEKPEDFCHRHLVAEWLNSNGYEVREY